MSEQKEQDAILITFDHHNRILCLDMEERGVLLTAIYEHYAAGGIDPDGECKNMSRETYLVLDSMVGQVDRYLAVSKIRSKAGKLGGIASGRSRREANRTKTKQKQANSKEQEIAELDPNDPDYDDKVGEILYR